ncbi:SDR family oxidoreductase [Vibrio fluvialis]|uniref:SDR family oxidoreductase n=1 Tax=Vibrio sp. bablab_jr001 TaxID=2755067 RepID=UPI0018F24060|nr:SDR family oxidoreductase [Vibrio sp. bablab_jr001]EKO3398404.1 SDR family oxidoreductase [Vibrio fluvialis]MBY8115221.1 SDR family oxidoreductase [Vibrio fluvialis]MBY8248313.1 SDR family oxidoreductase [Vibrio fluvialis]MBY8281983.1 SDR family oxidoreductase [Vibrio fluvialis]
MDSRIALITGASRGLGQNGALKLAKQGVDIILTYHSQAEQAQQVVAAIEALGSKAVAIQLDTGNISEFEPFVAEVKQVLATHWQRDDFDFLVNNAGIGMDASLTDASEALFDRLCNIHFKGVFFLTQALAPLVRDGGRILNVSTGLTRFAMPGKGVYAAMKGAIEVYTRYLAKELGSRGIRVNVLAPGAIETDFGGGAVRDVEAINALVSANTALGRAGLPDDIGGVMASLLVGDTGWIQGQRIEASGGMFL